MKLTSPYNFVPLNEAVYVPSWWNKVSQDIPFSDGEDGTIEVTLKNISPMFIRNGSARQDDDNKRKYSANVSEDSDHEKQYIIPGTSLKGMIANVLEIMSFGKMERYDNDFFGYREFNTNIPSSREYVDRLGHVRCGWLRKENDKYILTPCDGEWETATHSEIKEQFPTFKVKEDTAKKQESLAGGKPLYPIFKGKKLVCTGFMHNKKHEYLFPIECDKEHEHELTKDEKDRFLSIHKPSPDTLFENYFLKKLKSGEEIPVFYVIEKDRYYLGLSRMFRFPFKHRVSDGVVQDKSEGNDFCTTIFGYSSRNSSLRGRVQMGTAWADRLVDDDELIAIQGVLGQPKASYYPFYLSQKDKTYNNYDTDDMKIAGRKRYRVHKNNSVMELPQGNGNEAVLTHFNALPCGLSFTFKIRVHNLRPQETGALLSTLTFHGTDGCWHNIGLAKSLGYGKVCCEITSLTGFSHSKEEYLRSFETEMSIFTYSRKKVYWNQTTEVRTLAAIASEHHNDEDMKFMDLKEYGDGKNNKNFCRLTEKLPPCINSYLDDAARNNIKEQSLQREIEEKEAAKEKSRLQKLKEFSTKMNEAKQHEEEGNLEEAKKDYESIQSEMAKYGYNTPEITVKINELTNKIAEKKQKEEELRKAQEEKDKAEKQQAGLSFLTELNLNNQYKVKDWNGAKSRIEQWLKKEYPGAKKGDKLKLPAEQWEYLHNWLSVMYPLQKKGDQKKWSNRSDNMWSQTASWTSEDKTDEWFNEIIK